MIAGGLQGERSGAGSETAGRVWASQTARLRVAIK